MKYAACVEYDGSSFSGWQAQKHDVRTVQGCVETALSKVSDSPTSVITAGRTDTAVHATHQVIHFESDAQRTDFAWCAGTNRFMDRDVRLLWVVPIQDEFHARFSALSRSYRFVINNSPIKTAILRKQITSEHKPLDLSLMKAAGKHFIGEQDFSSLRAAGCQAKSPVRTITDFSIHQNGDWFWFDITANAFLQHMVRNIAGVLIDVGCGKKEPDWVAELITLKDRRCGAVTAQPNGLYLTGVSYPQEFNLPSNYRALNYW